MKETLYLRERNHHVCIYECTIRVSYRLGNWSGGPYWIRDLLRMCKLEVQIHKLEFEEERSRIE